MDPTSRPSSPTSFADTTAAGTRRLAERAAAAVEAAAAAFGGSGTSLHMFCDLEGPGPSATASSSSAAPSRTPAPLRVRVSTAGGADGLWSLDVRGASSSPPETHAAVAGSGLGPLAAAAVERALAAPAAASSPWRATLALVCGATSPGDAHVVFQASVDRRWALGSARTDWHPLVDAVDPARVAAWAAEVGDICGRATRVFEAFERDTGAMRRGTGRALAETMAAEARRRAGPGGVDVRSVALAASGVRRVFAGHTNGSPGTEVPRASGRTADGGFGGHAPFAQVRVEEFDAAAAAAARNRASDTLRRIATYKSRPTASAPRVFVGYHRAPAPGAGAGAAPAMREWSPPGRRLADGESPSDIRVVVSGVSVTPDVFEGRFPGSVDPRGVDPLGGTLSSAPLEALRAWYGAPKSNEEAREAARTLFEAWIAELCGPGPR